MQKVSSKLGVYKFKDAFFGILLFTVSIILFNLTFRPIYTLSFTLSWVVIDLTIPSYFVAWFGLYLSLGWIVYIFMGFLFSFRKKMVSDETFNPHKPLVSVLVSARNEERVIGNLLNDLKKQSYDKWEAVIVAHNCSDNTYKVAKSFPDKRIRALTFKGKYGKPVGLNHGVKHLKGDIVVVFDADARIENDFIEKLIPYFHVYDAVQCRIVSSNKEKNLLTSLIDVEYVCFTDLMMYFFGGSRLFGILGGTGQAVKLEILREINFWDEKCLVEDYDLSLTMVKKKYRIGFASNVKVFDEKPISWSSFFKQRARWLRGDFQIIKKHMTKVWSIPQVWHLILSHFGVFLFYYGMVLTFLYLFGATYQSFYFPFWFWLWLFQVSISFIRCIIERGIKGALLYPLFLLFTYHWIIVLLYLPKIKTWKESKTEHFGGNKNEEE